MRQRDTLRYDQTLFRDREVFEFAYVPDQLHHRDAQSRELALLARQAVRGGSPESAILRGPPGTGKTTTVLRLFSEIEEATQTIVPVYVNCQQDRTPLAVFRCIFEKLVGYAPPSTGTHVDDVLGSIVRRLRDRNAALLVCLDDANYLHESGHLNDLLYRLLRLSEKWDVRRAGVFAVSSDLALNLYAAVDVRVRSVFHPAEVFFPPYTKTEIREILAARIRQGLYPNVVPRAALALITDIAAEEEDVRVGIDLVRKAAVRAEADGRRTVTRNDVTEASRSIIAPALQTRAANLSESERALLSRIAEAARDGGAEVTSGAVYEAAQEYAPIGKTTYNARLKRLEEAGIVDLLLRTGRGRTREILLRYDPEQVLAACGRPGRT
ncbi:ORC1-type DNA replication protein [Methanoculleus sp. FWC-SCC1]|uniref:ORC1-type DNA replication protein n=1 Tax=Methanoculleus frigidifontis TaxID=2584085 RepID=A0ABT8M836_9EURY|nr:ORC1-type DNA replication protein [Methanoculleus sp. FWC-SCC1]MDN7024104.1 ORC1-type DNA replication protein [Methanoculleus sp. FWC-SCC1]